MLPIASDAQILPFRTYSIENGLSESVANDMLQDADGYIWVATGYGLNRFDGHNFRNYFEENGLLNNKIQSLYQDREGRLWIGTNGGVNVIEGDSIRTREVLNPLRRSTILEIIEDSQGEYWFATDGQGVWHLDGAGQLTQYSTVHGLVNDRVRDIIEDE
ncbi:MAG: two-component regulator propeller domain-containing protein, partial [Balneolaceae bacterium]|nr:two-component regulator propeller domain-containing protein [Balneolaceae bacterium]